MGALAALFFTHHIRLNMLYLHLLKLLKNKYPTCKDILWRHVKNGC